MARAERARRVGSQAGCGGRQGGMAGRVGGGQGRVAGLLRWRAGSGGGLGDQRGMDLWSQEVNIVS